MRTSLGIHTLVPLIALASSLWSAPAADQPTYRRLKAALDAVPAIDTHDHLWAFPMLAGHVETERGRGMNLFSIWQRSYFSQVAAITPWKSGGRFDDWWATAKGNFVHAPEMTRRCLAEVLAEKIDRRELREPDALRIGRQILRDNALALFPQLQSRLWKDRPAAPSL